MARLRLKPWISFPERRPPARSPGSRPGNLQGQFCLDWLEAHPDETLKVGVYVQDDNVVFIQAEGAISLDITDTAAAQKFGEWFGVSISGGVLGMALGTGDTSVLQDPELETKLQEDIKPLVYILENDFNEKTLAEGKAAVSTVYGYPCGLEVSGSTDGETVLLAMKIIVSGPEGQISVK